MESKKLNEIKLGNGVTAFELGGGEIPTITDELGEEMPKLDARFSKTVPENFIVSDADSEVELEEDVKIGIENFVQEQVKIDNQQIEYLTLCALRLSAKTGYIHNIHSDYSGLDVDNGVFNVEYEIRKSDVKLNKSQHKIIKKQWREMEKEYKRGKKLVRMFNRV